MLDSDNLPTIPEFYRGKKILVTGGSGFMGKVLLEKLLRSCPGLDTIYLLLRPKKGKEPSSRVKDITDVAIFNKLKDENPSYLTKLVAISGDVKQVGLGLSEEDRQLLQKEVAIIFHMAASVRLDDPLKGAILINVRGTLEVVKLALGMTKLEVFEHLSTTFSNFNRHEAAEVKEEIYSPVGNWRKMIEMAENVDDHLLRMLTPKILGTMINTYTYTKNLAEHLINDYRDQLPLVIVRPSIVISTVKEPMPGWIDNFNGPVGLWVAGWLGIIRVGLGDPDQVMDYVPVDKAIRSMIFITWQRALTSCASTSPLPIFNCCSMYSRMSHQALIHRGLAISKKYPMEKVMWIPNRTLALTTSKTLYFICAILLHVLPALVFDMLLRIKGQKPMILQMQRKLFAAMEVLSVFSIKENNFDNSQFLQLESRMDPADREAFSYAEVTKFNSDRIKDIMLGARKYLLKGPLSTLPQARIQFRRMYWLDKIFKTVLLLAILWAMRACGRTHIVRGYAQSMKTTLHDILV